MNNKDILHKIRTEKPKNSRIRAVTITQKGFYVVCVMASFIDGESMGAITFLEIKFKTQQGANTLKELINKEVE